MERLRFSEFLRSHYLPSLETRLTTVKLKATTKAAHETIVQRYIIPRLGSINLHELTTVRIKDFYRDLLVDGRVRGEGGALHPELCAAHTHGAP